MVGDQDTVTPPSLGRKVFDAIPVADKQFLLLPGANHDNAIRQQAAREPYCQTVSALCIKLPSIRS